MTVTSGKDVCRKIGHSDEVDGENQENTYIHDSFALDAGYANYIRETVPKTVWSNDYPVSYTHLWKDKSRVTTLALQEMQFISYTQNRQLCQRTANLLGLVVWKGIPVDVYKRQRLYYYLFHSVLFHHGKGH